MVLVVSAEAFYILLVAFEIWMNVDSDSSQCDRGRAISFSLVNLAHSFCLLSPLAKSRFSTEDHDHDDGKEQKKQC